MEEKTRLTESPLTISPFRRYIDNSTGGRQAPIQSALYQRTVSEGHPWHLLHKRDKPKVIDYGGAFETERYTWEPQYRERRFNAAIGGIVTRYEDGNLHVIAPTQGEFTNLKNSVGSITDATMDAWGTTAISQVIPTKSKVDLAVSAIELAREGLPKMIGQGLLKGKLKDFRKVGDELLNIEFGIKPLISDIQGTSKAIVEAAERLKQLERDSGRLVRRKFTFPDREELITGVQHGASACPINWDEPSLYLNWNYHVNRRDYRYKYVTRRWFSGAFTYYLDLGERQRSQLYAAADNARLLLGVKLDAEVLWNLAPWSWLADWFGNVGDIATNVSHFSRDGLVMPYGYMMAESSANLEVTSQLNWQDQSMPKNVTDKISYKRKLRRPANPFGFGLTDMFLDSRQLSILSALGISKAPRF